jgi:hypothetical protein
LRRLEQAGRLESRLEASESGPARKYYSVTPSGSEQLQAGTDTWARINGALGKLVEPWRRTSTSATSATGWTTSRGVALTLAGLAIGAVVWIDSYQPIAFAGRTQFPLTAKPSSGQAGETVIFRKGHQFEYGIILKGVYACTTGMGGPEHGGYGATTQYDFPVRFSFLWRTATASIPLDEPLTRSFRKEGCPPPKNPTITP